MKNPHCYWTKQSHSKYHPMISLVFAWDLFHCWIEFSHTLKQCYQLSTEYSIEITYLSKNIWVQLNWSQDHSVSFPSGNVSTADSSLSAQQLGNGDWLLLLLRYAEGQHFHFSVVHWKMSNWSWLKGLCNKLTALHKVCLVLHQLKYDPLMMVIS